MKQEIKTTEAIFPMPVLMISTFAENHRKRQKKSQKAG